MRSIKLLVTSSAILTTLLILVCTKDITSPNPNIPPTTTIANIPVEGDTIFALVKLQWDGGDDDGYVIGYEWKYQTTYSSTGQSVSTEWKFTPETSLTIAFNSSDSLGNRQEFQIRAIDNNKTADPTPEMKTFYTTQTVAPEVTIITPAAHSEYFIAEEITDWYYGIPLVFSGYDEDGDIVEFGWSVDGGEFNWTADTSLYITPDHFNTPLNGQHTIKVIARDNTNIVSLEGFAVTVNLVKATFEKDILIIDETIEREFPPSAAATDAQVDSFYAAIFGVPDPDDVWDYEYYYLRGKPLPPLSKLGQYKMVIWHADNRPTTEPHKLADHVDYFKGYMNIGGDFIMSGWRILKSFAWDRAFPTTFEDTSFVAEYLHILAADETPYYLGDCIGALGIFGDFSDIEVDAEKLQGNPFRGKLVQINTIQRAGGFTDILYRYRNEAGSTFPTFAGQSIGLLYTGTVFDAVILGFPIYFIKSEHAEIMADEMLRMLGYR